MAQTLLHGGQDVCVLRGLDVDDPVGVESDAAQGGREQVAPFEAPQDRPLEPRQDAPDEQGRGGRMFAGETVLDELVQLSDGKTAPGKMPVDRPDAEGQGRPARTRGAIEIEHPPTQVLQARGTLRRARLDRVSAGANVLGTVVAGMVDLHGFMPCPE